MSIVLLILKIIGIALLCILGLLLTLLLLVLFVPIRYTITAGKPEDEGFTAKIKITWLLHLLNVHVKYTDDLYYRVRVFVFSIIKSDNLKKKKETEKEADKQENTLKPEEIEERADKENIIEDVSKSEEVPAIEKSDAIEDVEETIEKKSIFEKTAFIIEKLFDFIFNIKEKLTAIYKKGKNVADNIDYYIEAFNDEKNRETIALCYNQLKRVLNNIKPKVFKGYAHIGLDDPYTMGQMLSIYGILFPLVHDKIQLVPDYDKEIIEGNLCIKGRITVFIVICAGVKIYFNKDFRRMQKIFKKEGL